MQEIYSIPLSKLAEEFNLVPVYTPENYEGILVQSPEVMRPGLSLTGFYEIFDAERLHLIGNAEHLYLSQLPKEQRRERIKEYVYAQPTAVIFTSGLDVFEEFVEYGKEKNLPIFTTDEKTSPLMASLISSLNTYLAPRITRHGVLIEIYGEGILLLGDSGVGKSETAIELVKRGHRLIADDAVEIKRVSSKSRRTSIIPIPRSST